MSGATTPMVRVTLADGSIWNVPQGWAPSERPGFCRSCHARILWATTPAAKAAPLDQDGHSHFASCNDPDRWRRPR